MAGHETRGENARNRFFADQRRKLIRNLQEVRGKKVVTEKHKAAEHLARVRDAKGQGQGTEAN